ncbi:putative protein isoform X3 [Capsicum chacoense]
MSFKTNVFLLTLCLLVLLTMMSSEVVARDMPSGTLIPSLKSNEEEGTTGSLDGPIKPQVFSAIGWPIAKFAGEVAFSYCMECQFKCCLPDLDHIPPN